MPQVPGGGRLATTASPTTPAPDDGGQAAVSALHLDEALRKRLQESRLPSRREALLAAAPHLHGLRVWVNGTDAALLDERGFVCSTKSVVEVILLCRFESAMGPGALRALLARPVIDPHAAISILAPRFTLKVKPVEHDRVSPKTPRKRLNAQDMARLLDGL